MRWAVDGDPLDALLITREPLPAGVRMAIRPIAVLRMRDRGQADTSPKWGAVAGGGSA